MWYLVISVAIIILLTTLVLLLMMIVFQEAAGTINETVFHVLWGILTYFTNASLRFPNIEEVVYDSSTPSPEQDTIRHFGAVLLLSRDKDGGGFIFWLTSVSCVSFYFNMKTQIDQSIFNADADEKIEEKMVRLFPRFLLFMTLLSVYCYATSLTQIAMLFITTICKTKAVFNILFMAFTRESLNRLYGYGEEIFLVIAMLFFCITSFIILYHRERSLLSLPVIMFCTELLIFIFNICKSVLDIYRLRWALLKNTVPCTASDLANNDECAICLLKMTSARMTPCKHVFHTKCLELVLHSTDRCPICRTNLQTANKTT